MEQQNNKSGNPYIQPKRLHFMPAKLEVKLTRFKTKYKWCPNFWYRELLYSRDTKRISTNQPIVPILKIKISKLIKKQISYKFSIFIPIKTIINWSKSGIKLLKKLFLQLSLFSVTVNQIQTSVLTIKRFNNYPMNKNNLD